MAEVTSEEIAPGVVGVRLAGDDEQSDAYHRALARIGEIFDEFARRDDLRAVLLLAYGKTNPVVETRADVESLESAAASIDSSRVPVIVALSGASYSTTLQLVLACHIRIASASATFDLSNRISETVQGKKRIQRLMGMPKRAGASAPSADLITADEALEIGLLNRVVPLDQVQSKAMAIAREIATLAPLAIRACLEAVMHGSELSLKEGLALEGRLFSELFSTSDMREGTRAFLEKRKPVFEGR